MITTMKLQKLCFYSQAYSLVKYNQQLFPEDFRAWKNSPVVSPEKLGSNAVITKEKEKIKNYYKA